MDYVEFFTTMESYGLTDVLIPFLLIFTIVFAVLQKSNILGVGKKNFNVIISLVMALTTVIPHVTNSYPPGYDVVSILNTALPQVSVVAVAFIMLLLLVGLFGAESRWLGSSLSGWMAIISFIIIVIIFVGAGGWWYSVQDVFYWWDDDTTALVLMILTFAIIIWFVTKSDTKEEGGAKLMKGFENIGNFFGGKK